MPTVQISTSYEGLGPAVVGAMTLVGSMESVIGPLSVAQGTPDVQSITVTIAGLKAVMFKSTKNATVTTNLADVITLTAGIQYLWTGVGANPFAAGNVTTLTFACTETGLTAVINGRILHNE